MKHVWIHYIEFSQPKTYIVLVDGGPYDTLIQRSGKKLRRDDMRDIAAGYAEWLNFSL